MSAVKNVFHMDPPNERQKLAMQCRAPVIFFGGARSGGKSWFVQNKACLLAFRFPGIRIGIVRKTYPELYNNHIKKLKEMLRVGHPDKSQRLAKYNEQKKEMTFPNGSTIVFQYCDTEKDSERVQGIEYDVLFIDESTNMSEQQIQKFRACIRGANPFPKRLYLTGNPGGQSHAWHKRLFVDRKFQDDEKPEDYAFFQSKVTDNVALMEMDPEYIHHLEALPAHLRAMWLEGRWDIFAGQFFEEIRTEPDREKCLMEGITQEIAAKQHRWTHIIEPFEIPYGWRIYRSYDWGYNHPFSMAWWAVDYDGTLYRILELYGCTDEPNVGVRWTTDKQFAEAQRLEKEHPLLAGHEISGGVADPAIWEASHGESIAETAERYGIYFDRGDNKRIPGWMQVHYRLQFDENGYSRMYVFSNCKAWIRTMPSLLYSETIPEDVDTEMEDHVADETRYMCMSRPVEPRIPKPPRQVVVDPLDQITGAGPQVAYRGGR